MENDPLGDLAKAFKKILLHREDMGGYEFTHHLVVKESDDPEPLRSVGPGLMILAEPDPFCQEFDEDCFLVHDPAYCHGHPGPRDSTGRCPFVGR